MGLIPLEYEGSQAPASEVLAQCENCKYIDRENSYYQDIDGSTRLVGCPRCQSKAIFSRVEPAKEEKRAK